MAGKPYLSVVLVARNDNYGGDFNVRLQTFLRALSKNLAPDQKFLELEIVEWNPPTNQLPLFEAFDWPSNITCNIHTVEPYVHQYIAKERKIPVFEYIGKNVGLQRARGDFALVTNPDVIFSKNLLELIAKKRLDKNSFYRIDRLDFDGTGISYVPDDDLVEFAKTKIVSANVRHSENGDSISYVFDTYPSIEDIPRSYAFSLDKVNRNDGIIICSSRKTLTWGGHTNASGDFILASKKVWQEINGFWERKDTFTHLDSFAVVRLLSLGYTQRIFGPEYFLLHMDHDRSVQSKRKGISSKRLHKEMKEIYAAPYQSQYAYQTIWGLPDRKLPCSQSR